MADAETLPRVLFFGMPCRFTAWPLLALLEAGVPITGLIMPGERGGPSIHALEPPLLRVLSTQPDPDPVQLAWTHGVRALRVGGFDGAVVDALRRLQPDLIAAACFPRRLPLEVLELARLGALNVHPSLLPARRGPDPLFWTFRDGDESGGVTIHLMDAGLDTGPIVKQQQLPIPRGVWGADFEREVARVGGALLLSAIRCLSQGDCQPVDQPADAAAPEPRPTQAALVVAFDRPAQRVHHFVRGAAGMGYPLRASLDGHDRLVLDSIGFDDAAPTASPARLGASPGVVAFRCQPGIAWLRLGA